jgi:small conductance mechanosensitive channel
MAPRRKQKTKVLRVRVILLLLLASLPAYAQEDAAEPETIETPEPIELTAEVAAQLDARIEAIERQEQISARLIKRFESSEGLAAELYGGRMDAVWAEMFDDSVTLARDVVALRNDGFDVADYAADLARDLDVFPDQSAEALNRLRNDIVYPMGDLDAAQYAIQDQVLLRATEKVDFVLQSLLTYVSIVDELGIDNKADLDALIDTLEESAANRSTFLLLSIERVAILRAAAAALPSDVGVAAQLSVAEARVQVASKALQSIVGLMNQIDLDAAHYSQQVVTTTGELTSDVLDVGVIAAIIREWSTFVADLARTEGPRLLFRLFIVVLILFLSSRLSRIVQSLTKKALSSSRVRLSALLTEMIVATVRNLVLLLGILIALSQVGISLGPLLAGLGIAGFIIGFALQDTLSNFASGMLILIYRPFDVGDFVTAGGVTGKVSHMSVVNATFKTIDNQVLVVPNNLIWSSVITNVTAQRLRRVDLVFGVAYSDDIEKVEAILADVVNSHELVLDEPEPMIHLHELADSSVNFVCRPWVKTDDYWDVYWDVLRTVKMRFDAEGITIPFPQREIHTSSS